VKAPKPEKPESKADAEARAAQQPYQAQLDILNKMGFDNAELNLYLLGKAKGDLQQVVPWLLEMRKF
jgi:hypothetical protein